MVLDLGRPDRLIIAMTHYNFKSIFTWNVFLYIGFALVVIIYLWMMFEPRMKKYVKPAGTLALIWRVVLTTGTGSIFGVLLARDAYDSLMMVPLFIVLSIGFGTAIFILFVYGLRHKSFSQNHRLIFELSRLMTIFIITSFVLTIAFYLFKLLIPFKEEFVNFILFEMSIYPILFWFGYVLIGSILPFMIIQMGKTSISVRKLAWCSFFHLTGGVALLYVIIIGGQAYPLILFPGMEISSSFQDGKISQYTPSIFEFSLGLGGSAVALIGAILVMRVLPFVPEESVTIPSG